MRVNNNNNKKKKKKYIYQFDFTNETSLKIVRFDRVISLVCLSFDETSKVLTNFNPGMLELA